jgi:MFS family permease
VALLSESPHPLPIHRRILLFTWLGWIFDFYDLYLLSLLIASTSLAQDLEMGRQAQAVLLGSSLGFSALGGLGAGWLADRYGRKPILMLTIIIYSAGTCLSGLAVDATTLFAARAFTGLGVGGEWAVAHAMVGETVPPHVRGRYGAYLQSGATVGLILATAVGNFAAPAIGWRWTFILSSLPALIVLAIRRYMPESDMWQAHRGEQARVGVKQIAALIGPGLRRATTLAFAVTICAMAAYWIKTIRLPSYYQELRGFSLAESAVLQWVGHAGSLLGYVLFGHLADRFGRRSSFFSFAMIKTVGLALLTIGWALISPSPVTLYLVIFLVGFGEGNWGGVGPLLSELFPTHVRAYALGVIYNFSRGMQLLAPIMIAWVAAGHSLAEGIAFGAVFALLSGLLVWTLPETRGITLRKEGAATG